MSPLIEVSSVGIPLVEDNIDTDQLLPKQFLTEISRQGFGRHLFHDRRYLDQFEQQPNPDFILNQPQYAGAHILISGKNFGCGSSREHAPWALADFGIRVIIAKGFADIFYANCLNNQILPITLAADVVDEIAQRACFYPDSTIDVDLRTKRVTYNQKVVSFDIPQHHQTNLLNGVDKVGRTLQVLEKIDQFEQFKSRYA